MNNKPLKLDTTAKTAAAMVICGFVGTLILLTVEGIRSSSDALLKCCMPLLISLLPAVMLWLLHLQIPQLSLTEQGILIENRRKGLRMQLPWTDFSYAYKIELSTVSKVYPFFLLTDKPMSKELQKEIYEKCAQNRETPYVYEGCVLIAASHYGREIEQRLSEHIRIMPWDECAHF